MYLHQYYNTQDVRPCQHFQNVTDQLAINNKNNLIESLWNSVSIASRYIFKNKFLGSQVVRYVDCITDSDRISSSFLYDIIKGNDSHKIDRNQWNAFFDESTNRKLHISYIHLFRILIVCFNVLVNSILYQIKYNIHLLVYSY